MASAKLFTLFQYGHIRPSYFQANVFSKFSFINCYGCGFIKYLNIQRISKLSSLLYSIDITASPAESSVSNVGMRVWVQPAKPDLSVRLLCDQLPKVYVFSAHKIFTIFCAPFPNKIFRFKILAMP